ncbi:MAG: monovalent cation/H(+) antiporter subunit G [Chthoniobacterales bacterium]|nr:monovalent cation/H(+) antiporter subunit G [Chthoniobacterales bacterium]
MTWVVGSLLVLGAFLMFLTGLGLLRMPDIFTRMHAATKGASLGVALLLLGAALVFQEVMVVTKAVVTVGFIFLTAPVAASLLGRAAYARRTPLWEGSVMDEGRGKINVPINPVADQEDATSQETKPT